MSNVVYFQVSVQAMDCMFSPHSPACQLTGAFSFGGWGVGILNPLVKNNEFIEQNEYLY